VLSHKTFATKNGITMLLLMRSEGSLGLPRHRPRRGKADAPAAMAQQG